MNKKIIKKVFDKNINKNNIYDGVMNRVSKKRFNYLKLSIIPICVIILICFTNIKENKNILNEGSNIININKLNNVDEIYYDIAWNGVSVTKEEITLKFSWINELNNFALDYSNYIDLKDDNNETYLMILSYDNINLEIFISEISEKKPRCIVLPIEEDSKDSIIDGVTIKIYKRNNTYIALFNVNEFNYDVEISNISEEEFIKLIKLIIKEEEVK